MCGAWRRSQSENWNGFVSRFHCWAVSRFHIIRLLLGGGLLGHSELLIWLSLQILLSWFWKTICHWFLIWCCMSGVHLSLPGRSFCPCLISPSLASVLELRLSLGAEGWRENGHFGPLLLVQRMFLPTNIRYDLLLYSQFCCGSISGTNWGVRTLRSAP